MEARDGLGRPSSDPLLQLLTTASNPVPLEPVAQSIGAGSAAQ